MLPRLLRPAKSLRTTLEVERKFLPTLESLAGLRANTGERPFVNHRPLGLSTYHDIYYDRAGELMKRGIYVRLRNGDWEAKVRSGGDFLNSQFTEYNKREEIEEILRSVSASIGQSLRLHPFDLSVVANFVTKRESWDLDGFRVVVDETDFGHNVGEVELCQVFDVNTIHALSVSGQGLATAGRKMDHKINTFMNKYRWAFPTSEGGQVMGKLSAYMLLVEKPWTGRKGESGHG
ncbi:CYTH-like domain-containing protein [Lophiotrema nucula]|uniref:CYTH-like domain-containing protein n=1 Tax=Lophiotrema nucula TaxID=690887 RepID=A0A6A5ZCM8_9PLEO|nr:CYTH-like domain-containing protein [Lophiotrema nucula]